MTDSKYQPGEDWFDGDVALELANAIFKIGAGKHTINLFSAMQTVMAQLMVDQTDNNIEALKLHQSNTRDIWAAIVRARKIQQSEKIAKTTPCSDEKQKIILDKVINFRI